MKPFALLASFCFLSLLGYSQESIYTYKPVTVNLQLPPDTAIAGSSARQAKALGLSDFERDFLYNLNYCRAHPAIFVKRAVVPYLDAYPRWKPVYGESLVADLGSIQSPGGLLADAKLLKVAREHASDLAIHDRMSHESSDGTTTQQRFQKIGVVCGSECINMGNYPNALEVLLSLLIDYGVSNFGHRKSLLSPKMKSIGLGAARNVAGDIQYTVADMGCD